MAVDPVPRLIGGAEWDELEAGLLQRARALNLFLADAWYRDALASFDCRLMTTFTVQTHTVLIGRAVAVRSADTAVEPLIYYDGRLDHNRAALSSADVSQHEFDL